MTRAYADEDELEEFEDELEDEDEVECPSPECGCKVCGWTWRACIHECGHVVGALAYGFTFDHVHATGTGDGMEGAVMDVDGGVGAEDRAAHVVIALMGPQAEIAWFGGQLGGGDGDTGDYAEADELAERDDVDLDEAEEIADDLLEEWADALEAVARALFEAGALTYAEAVEYAE